MEKEEGKKRKRSSRCNEDQVRSKFMRRLVYSCECVKMGFGGWWEEEEKKLVVEKKSGFVENERA
jgi:hypothetical protein